MASCCHRLQQRCSYRETARPFFERLPRSSTHITPMVLMTEYEVTKDFVRDLPPMQREHSKANVNRTLAQSTLSYVDLSAPLLLGLCS